MAAKILTSKFWQPNSGYQPIRPVVPEVLVGWKWAKAEGANDDC
jgi:hypothetical protein